MADRATGPEQSNNAHMDGAEYRLIAEQLRSLVDTVNAVIVGISPDHEIIEWNHKAEEISGIVSNSAKQFGLRHILDTFVLPEYQKGISDVLDAGLEGQETDGFEFIINDNTGNRRTLLMNVTSLRSSSQEITGVYGVCQDITEIRTLAAEQRVVAEDYSRLIETANAPIFGVNTHGLVTEWNRKAADLSGFPQEETLGKPLVDDFIIPEFKEKVQEVLEQALKGCEAANFEFPLITKTGMRLQILLNATTRRDAEGKVVGVVGVGQDITKLHKAMMKAQAIAIDLTRLIETANAPIIGIDKEGCVTEWNHKAVDTTGYSKEDALGKPLVDTFITEEFRESVWNVLKDALSGKETANFEFPLFTRDGVRREILLNATTRRSEDGQVVGVFGVGQDITELRAVTLEQHRIAEDLTRLIEHANAAIFNIGLDGCITEWNRKAAEVSGFSAGETIGRKMVEDFVIPEFKEAFQDILNKALRGEQAMNFEFTFKTKSGHLLTILLNATTRRNVQGEITGCVCVAQDITSMREAWNAANHIADDLTRLIDTANAPIFGIDTSGCVTEWNQKAAEISGYDKAYAEGKPLVESFISPEYREEVTRVLSEALQGHETSNFEFPLFMKSGSRREILLNATTRRSASGEITGVIGVGQDITELQSITEEHKQVADDLSRLIETANAPIFGVDISGRVTEWNRKAAELSGWSKEEAMGQNMSGFITHEAKKQVETVLSLACHGKEASNFEMPLSTKDGNRIDILLNATTRRNAQGSITGCVGVGQDITIMQSAMHEARRVADDLTRLIDKANAPIFGIDPHGNVNEWNQKAASISGWSKAESLGKSLVDCFISEGYREEVGRVLRDALAGKDTANYEFPLFTKDGSRREILLNATTRHGSHGEVIGVVGVGQDITDLRAVTKEQHRIAEDLSRLIETANAPIFGVNVEGMVTEWNQKAAQLSMYSKEETMGHPLVAEFITMEYKDKVQAVLNDACNGNERANFEFPLVNKDGKRIDILLNATPRRDEKGEVMGVVGVGQDITILREAMDETQRHADDLTRLIDTANAPIFGIDTEGHVTEWNQQAATISGYAKSETKGKPLVEHFITEAYRHEVNRVLTNALQGDETANFNFPLFTKDGRRREILLNATSRRGADGRVVGVIGVGQDITELLQVTLAQQQVADDLQRLIDTANAPIFGVCTEGKVVEWNRKAAELSGFTKEETVGRPLVEAFITSDYKEKVQSVLSKACEGVETANFEFPLMTKDGKRTDILLNATTRRNAVGEITGVVGVGQEITNLRQAMNEVSRVADDLTRVIDTANAPIFGIDTKGLVTEWNKKAAQISGWDASAALGKPLVQCFISEDYREEVGNVLNMALVGQETANYGFPLFTKDGSRREILLNATARKGADGAVTGVIGVGQDITELRAMTAEQHRIADDLSRLIETANAPIFGVDIDGKVTEWNRKAAELSGYSQEETMGRPLVEEFITEDFKEKVQAVLTQALEGEEAANFEFPLLTKDKRRIDILLNATTRRNAEGKVKGVVGVGQDITKFREALNTSTSIAADLTSVIDSANAPIFGINTEGLVTEWNQKAAAISGWGRDATLGKPLVECFISELYREQVSKVLNAALNGDDTANFEFPLFTKDNRRREILLNATARRDPLGDIVGVIGVGQDITEMRTLMAEQHRIADDLSRLIETANAPIFGVSVAGLVTEWNKKAAELSGYSKEETMGKPLVQNFITEQYQDQVQMVLKRACQGRETSNFEFPLMTKDGRRMDILLNATTRRSADDEIVGVVGVGQDITELREAMSYSRQVADDLTRLIDTANAPIFGIDTQGCVTEWNRMAYRITRFHKQSVIGQPLIETIIPVDQREVVREVFENALKGQEVANFELFFCTKSGDKREILLNATTRRGPGGEIVGMLGVGQDITELNSQRREAERIAGDLARLIDSANTPIVGVDVKGCVKEWNRKAAELSGWSKDDIKGERLVQKLVAEECQHEVAYVLLKALGGEETTDFEFPLLTATGETRSLLMNATAMRGNDGDVTGVIGVGHDVSEIRQMAAEQKNIADDLAWLVKSANAPIFGVNTAGLITEWNDMAAAILGYSKDDVLGKPFVSSFIRRDVQDEVGRVISDACWGKETTHFECPLINRENKEVLVLLNAASRIDTSGKIVGMVGVGQDITTLRQTMKEHILVADDLRRIIENANAPILAIDTDGCVTEWNLKVSTVSGYSKAEMLGKNLLETFINKEYRMEVGRVLELALDGKETDNYELPLFTKTGGRHTILFNATTRRGADGRITGVIGVGQDITKLRAITMEQERIADDLSRLIETANAPIFGVDTGGLVTEWNLKAEEISGFAKQETYGRPLVQDFIHEEHRGAVQSVLDQALQSRDVGNFELMLYTKGGDQRDVLLNATSRKGSQGEVIGVVCVGQDITELNQHRLESERIADDLSRLIKTANAPIFGVDQNVHITEWNGWVARNSGYEKNEVVGKKLTEYLMENSKPEVLRVFREASKGILTKNFEVELATRTHKTCCVLLNATPRVSWNGEIVGIICVGQDITNIKEMEQKKASFMAMVSHELKSPLHGIIGLSQSLNENENLPDKIAHPLQLIFSCGARLLDMVTNIMDASVLVQDKKMKFSRDQVQMGRIVNEVVSLCQHAIDKRGVPIMKEGVTLRNDIIEQLPEIEADQHRCTQVIYNLVTNALKFTHQGYVRVKASADYEREMIIVSVEDSGIGIAKDSLTRIFQPFDQEDQSETRKYDGLGLGLAICREVVYRHGGSLSVESEKGKGATFHVCLPFRMVDMTDSEAKDPKASKVASAASPKPAQDKDKDSSCIATAPPPDHDTAVTPIAVVEDAPASLEEANAAKASGGENGGVPADAKQLPAEPLAAPAAAPTAPPATEGAPAAAEPKPAPEPAPAPAAPPPPAAEGGPAAAKKQSVAGPPKAPSVAAPKPSEPLPWPRNPASEEESYKSPASAKPAPKPLAIPKSETPAPAPKAAAKEPPKVPKPAAKAPSPPKADQGPKTGPQAPAPLPFPKLPEAGSKQAEQEGSNNAPPVVQKSSIPLPPRQELPPVAASASRATLPWPAGCPVRTPSPQTSQTVLPPVPVQRVAEAKYTILSVDDDEVNQEVMKVTLGTCDWEADIVMNGAAALQYIEESPQPPDIILLDLMMPGISGMEVLAEVRKKYSLIDLPIIMVSAKNCAGAVVKGLEAQCNDWVHKPFDGQELIARMKTQFTFKEYWRMAGATTPIPPALSPVAALKDSPMEKTPAEKPPADKPDKQRRRSVSVEDSGGSKQTPAPQPAPAAPGRAPATTQDAGAAQPSRMQESEQQQQTNAFLANVLRQNAHLVVELRGRDRAIVDLKAAFTQETYMRQRLEQRAAQLERSLVIREADNNFVMSRLGLRGGLS